MIFLTRKEHFNAAHKLCRDDWSDEKNIGQLNNSNGKRTTLKTLTAFNVKEIFITAENQGDLSYPMGTEISRTTFGDSKMKKLTSN
jgi:hypothetical protein